MRIHIRIDLYICFEVQFQVSTSVFVEVHIQLKVHVRAHKTYANEIKEAKVGEAVRLLSTDNNLALPAKMPLRALISSSDVLHS